MFYDNIFKIESSDKTDKIPKDIRALFNKATKIYEEYRQLSIDNDFPELEKERREHNIQAIRNLIYDALHKIKDMEVLTQLYNLMERTHEYCLGDLVLNVFCFNMANQKVWNVIAKSIADNESVEEVSMNLLSFRMPYYGNGKYLVENFDRHIGTRSESTDFIIEKPTYTQLTFDFF